MLRLLIPVVACGMALSSAAMARSAATPGAPSASRANASAADRPHNVVTIDKLKRDLRSAGFSDVAVVADAFVVRAMTKDGNPVVMMLGPRGVTAVEAIDPQSSSRHTGNTGSAGGSASGSSSSASGPQHK